jgi:hypothetical protein
LSGPGSSAAAAAGDAPSTMGPLACFTASASSACPRSISRHALRARSRNVCPCFVSSVPRAVRRDECHTELGFERAQALRRRRLGDSERARRPTDAAGFGERNELAQLGKTDRHNRMLCARSLGHLVPGRWQC